MKKKHNHNSRPRAMDVRSALDKLKTMDRPELMETEEYCDIPFIFLTAASSKDEEIRGLAGGAIDYIKKPFSLSELEKKIQSIISLRKKMKKHEIMNIRKGIDSLFSKIESEENQTTGKSLDYFCIKYGISAREKEIIALVNEGLINKEIAHRLNLSLRAVEFHITNIFKKVGVSKRFDLLIKFRM